MILGTAVYLVWQKGWQRELQRQAAFGPNFQTGGDGFADIGDILLTGISLADAAWNGRAFGDLNAVFIPAFFLYQGFS